MTWTSDRRLYLTPKGEVSLEPVSGGRLLVPLGGELTDQEAARYGLIGSAPLLESKPLRGKRTKG